jgi:putative membrane protein
LTVAPERLSPGYTGALRNAAPGAPMTQTIVFAFLHHAAAFAIVAVLTAELVLLKDDLTLVSARSVLRMDAAYGIAALALLVVGFLRVFYTEKGADYYFHSGTFLAKIALFAIVGLLSIRPTLQFLRWRTALRAGRVPELNAVDRRRIRMLVHIELTLLFVVMLLAVMMARGIGFFG